MASDVDPQSRLSWLSSIRLADVAIGLVAVASLTHAILTAPDHGGDIKVFYKAGRDWLEGESPLISGAAKLYPPFAYPLFSLLAHLQVKYVVLLWLLINLAATAVVVLLTCRLMADKWPRRTVIYLAAFFIAWAPFRVTLRMGQNSLVVSALLMAALLSLQKRARFASGLLLALSLVKYSMTLPFMLYIAWKREWKILAVAIALMLLLTEVYARHLGTTILASVSSSVAMVSSVQMVGRSGFTGTTGIRMLLWDLTDENAQLTLALTTAFRLLGLAAMAIVFVRRPRWQTLQFAALSLFALWSAYHRVYDSVLCIIPTALVVDFIVKKKFVRFARFWLGAMGLLVLNIPGLLTERLRIRPTALLGNPFGFLALHIERLLILGMFCSLLWLAWRSDPGAIAEHDEPRPTFPDSEPRDDKPGPDLRTTTLA